MKTHASQHRQLFQAIEPLESRIAPALITAVWLGGDGNWSDPSKWNIGVVPNNGGGNEYNVVLDVPGAVTVLADGSFTVDSIDNHEALTIAEGGSLVIGTSTNAGTIRVPSGNYTNETVLKLGGVLSNTGSIELEQHYPYVSAPRIHLAADASINGAGAVNFNTGSALLRGEANTVLTLGVGQVLRGAGAVQVPVNNYGTISADFGGTMNLPVVIENHGVIRADSGAIKLDGSAITGGTLQVIDSAGSHVDFYNDVTVSGVTLVDGGAGYFQVPGGYTSHLHGDLTVPAGVEFMVGEGGTLDLSGGSFANAGTIRLPSGNYGNETVLKLGGVLSNTGNIELDQHYPYVSAPRIHLAADASINGAGAVNFNTGSALLRGEANTVLTLGVGQVLRGAGGVQVPVNNYGTISADIGGTLTLTQAVDNHGSMEAVGSGALSLVGNSVTNTGRTIRAAGGVLRLENSAISGGTVQISDASASRVDLYSDVTFTGVTLADGGAGYFYVPGGVSARLLGDRALPVGLDLIIGEGGTLDLSGGSFANAGTIRVPSGNYTNETVLKLGGVLTNTGSIELEQHYPYVSAPRIHLAADASINGAGAVNFNTGSALLRGEANTVLTLGVGQVLRGAGAVQVPVNNYGTISADFGGTMTLTGNVKLMGNGGLLTDASGQIVLAANLLGDNDALLPASALHARVRIDGTGDPLVPRLFEVQGADLGFTSAGFTQNPVLDLLTLNTAFVRLVDNTNDAPGTDALYIDSLVVPSGSTLDLNDCRIYVRNADIQGTLIGDLGAPESHVAPLPSVWLGTTVPVVWTGTDDVGGSGVAAFDVFVSRDSAPFQLWLDDTAETSSNYTAEEGHTYAFYTIARDNIGYVEAAPLVPDTTTEVRVLTITTSGLDGATEDANYGFTMQSNGDGIADVPLTWTLTAGPAALTIGAASGALGGILDNTYVGDHEVTVRVADNQGHHAEQTFTLSVANTPGVFLNQTTTPAQLGNAYTFDLNSTDEGHGAVTYNVVSGPAWLMIDPANGVLGGKPGTHDIGAPSVTVGVDDGHGGTDTKTFTLAVQGQHLVLDPALKQTKAVFTDANGDTVTVAFTGKAGRVDLYRSVAPDGIGQYLNTVAGDIYAIELDGTGLSNSLTLTAKANTKLHLGDGFSTFGSLAGAGSLAKLSAAKFDIVGAGVSLPGNTIVSSTLHDVKNGADITLGGAQALKGVSFTAHDIEDGSAFAFGSPTKLFKATEWTGGTLSATSASSVMIAGNLDAALSFSGPVKLLKAGSFSGGSIRATTLGSMFIGHDANFDLTLTDALAKTTLGAAKVGGDLLKSVWDVAGKIASITVARTIGDTVIRSGSDITKLSMGASDGSVFGAGVDLATLISNGHTTSTPMGTIKTFSVNGWKLAKTMPIPRFMFDTQVSAKIGTMSVHNWDGLGGLWAPTGGIKKIMHHDTVQKDKEHNWVFPEPLKQVSGQPELFVHIL